MLANLKKIVLRNKGRGKNKRKKPRHLCPIYAPSKTHIFERNRSAAPVTGAKIGVNPFEICICPVAAQAAHCAKPGFCCLCTRNRPCANHDISYIVVTSARTKLDQETATKFQYYFFVNFENSYKIIEGFARFAEIK